MPVYEYRCPKCGDFEVSQRITEDPLKRCPECRRKVTKLISTTSFQLKGSGWYATDYASKPPSGNGKADSEGGSAEAAPAKKPKSGGKTSKAAPAA